MWLAAQTTIRLLALLNRSSRRCQSQHAVSTRYAWAVVALRVLN